MKIKEIKTIFFTAFFVCVTLMFINIFAQSKIILSTLKAPKQTELWFDINMNSIVSISLKYDLGHIPTNFKLLWRRLDNEGNVIRYGVVDADEWRTPAASTASVYVGPKALFYTDTPKTAAIYSRGGCCGDAGGWISGWEGTCCGQVRLIAFSEDY